jgi:hypothetical protein
MSRTSDWRVSCLFVLPKHSFTWGTGYQFAHLGACGRGRTFQRGPARDRGTAIAEAVAAALVRSVGQRTDQTPAFQGTWQALKEAIEQRTLTLRQGELELVDLLGLCRSQIAEVMG